jgi:hypothetical protein
VQQTRRRLSASARHHDPKVRCFLHTGRINSHQASGNLGIRQFCHKRSPGRVNYRYAYKHAILIVEGVNEGIVYNQINSDVIVVLEFALVSLEEKETPLIKQRRRQRKEYQKKKSKYDGQESQSLSNPSNI